MAKTFRLPNGVTCVCEERPQSGKVSMQVFIKSGSLHETDEENGLTFLTQMACFGGTATRTREEIAEGIESKGGDLTSRTGRTMTLFKAAVLARYADETFDILADVIRNPSFEAAEVQKVKTQIEQWISKEAEIPSKQAEIRFYEAAFAGQTMAGNPMGTEELLASFTPQQVKRKHAELLAHPENIVFSFAGDISAAQAKKLVEDYFGDLPAAAPTSEPPITFTGGDYREATNNEQLNLKLGFRAPSESDPDRFTVIMLEEYLSGGISSPLFQEIREKRGLVYGVGAAYAAFDTEGFFCVSAGTGKGNAGELISVTLDLLGQVVREGVDDKMLAQTRERIVTALKDSRETANGTCADNADQLLSHGRLISLEELEDSLNRVTSDDIRRVCANMLKDGKYALAGVGPQETMPSAQEIRDMMQKQLDGVMVPEPLPVAVPSLKTQFALAEKKAETGDAEPKLTILKNGMIVVTMERPGNLSCGAWVGAGSDHETPVLNGATHMNEHMMFKGTPSYGPGVIDRIIEGELGGGLNAYTSKDKTAYYFFNLKPDALEKTVDICGEMVFKANLDHKEFNGPEGGKGERDVVIEEIRRSNDSVGSRKWDVLMEAAYPDQPHGRPVLGTESNIRAMTVEQLAAYRDEYYAPNNVVFSAAGPVKHEDFVALIESKFGDMPAQAVPPLPTPVYKGGTSVVEMDSARLCNLTLAAESVSYTDPDNPAYEVLGMILGGGMSSRLYKEIVNNRELAPGVVAEAADFRNCGMFYVAASVAPEKVRPFVEAVYAEIRELTTNLTQEELDKAKVSLEMAILCGNEKNRNACDKNGNNALAYGKLVTFASVSEQIKNLTVEDIKRVAGKVLESNPTFAVVAPKGVDRRLIPDQEEVIALRDKKGQDSSPRPNGPEA